MIYFQPLRELSKSFNEDKQDLIHDKTDDPINPSHYKLRDGIQSFDFQQAVCERLPGNEASLVFNILKYVTRYKFKNGIIDLKKSKWYLEKLISIVEGSNNET